MFMFLIKLNIRCVCIVIFLFLYFFFIKDIKSGFVMLIWGEVSVDLKVKIFIRSV